MNNNFTTVSEEEQQQQLALLLEQCNRILDNGNDNNNNNNPISASDEIVKRLRVFRNSFASSPTLSLFLLEAGLLEVLERGMDALRDGTIFFGDETPVRRVIAQLMANATSASVDWCHALGGPRIFPERYTYMALTEHTDISSALALSLYNISKKYGNGDFMKALVGPQGCLVLSMMLQTEERFADSHGENDALGLLLSYACLEKEYLKDLFCSLSLEGTAALNSNHVLLLQRLVHDVSLLPVVVVGRHVVTYLHGLIRSLAINENDSIDDVSGHVLQQCLHLLREVAARQDDELCDVMLDEGLMKDLLSMLEALSTSDTNASFAPYKKVQPYKGYKSDVLSIIANASHRRTRVQEYIIQMNGVMMILHHLQADPDSPLSREWALYAVRNLCEGSAEARDAIQELQRVDVSSSSSARDAVVGDYEVMYEKEHGRVKIGLRK